MTTHRHFHHLLAPQNRVMSSRVLCFLHSATSCVPMFSLSLSRHSGLSVSVSFLTLLLLQKRPFSFVGLGFCVCIWRCERDLHRPRFQALGRGDLTIVHRRNAHDCSNVCHRICERPATLVHRMWRDARDWAIVGFNRTARLGGLSCRVLPAREEARLGTQVTGAHLACLLQRALSLLLIQYSVWQIIRLCLCSNESATVHAMIRL